MTTETIEVAEQAPVDTPDTRRCIGSTKFGIAAHDAPPTDFPPQPSQPGGLGRMCRIHWNQYTTALRKDLDARKASGEYQAKPKVAVAGPSKSVAKRVSAQKAARGLPKGTAASKARAKPARAPKAPRAARASTNRLAGDTNRSFTPAPKPTPGKRRASSYSRPTINLPGEVAEE